jgi:hypothetical protein
MKVLYVIALHWNTVCWKEKPFSISKIMQIVVCIWCFPLFTLQFCFSYLHLLVNFMGSFFIPGGLKNKEENNRQLQATKE